MRLSETRRGELATVAGILRRAAANLDRAAEDRPREDPALDLDRALGRLRTSAVLLAPAVIPGAPAAAAAALEALAECVWTAIAHEDGTPRPSDRAVRDRAPRGWEVTE